MVAEKATRADTVHAQLRKEIFDGALHPGQRLRLLELAQRFSASQSVIREALSRLAGQGLVTSTPQQGFSVITLSLKRLDELTEARMDIEPIIFRRSIQRGSLAWESQAVAAHHHLAAIPMAVDDHPNPEWFAVHEQFHQALLAGCGNETLLHVALTLRDSSAIYRHWAHPLGNDNGRDVAQEHQALLHAAITRDAALGAALLAAHIDRTADAFRPMTEESTGLSK